MSEWKGVVPAMVTPLKDRGENRYRSNAGLLRFPGGKRGNRAFVKGDLPKARQCQLLIDKLRAVAGDGCYIDAFKKALESRGVRAGCVRAPHRELSAEEVAKLRESLKELKLIS